MRDAALRLLTLAMVLLLASCRATPRIPTHPAADGAASLAVIADRQASIKSIQGAANVELAKISGQSVILDAAIVAVPPNRIRLRAWKLDRAVFDATILNEELWLVPPDDPNDESRLADADRIGGGIRHAFALLGPEFYTSATVRNELTTATILIAAGRVGATNVSCEIDRPTLTARRFEILDDGQSPRAVATIDLDDYREINGIVWPMKITIHSADGQVTIHSREIELNGAIQPNAFNPPRRAVRRP